MSPIVPLLDLRAQFARIRDEVNQAMTRVVESQQFILGPEVESLEAELADYCSAKYAVACSSGTDALLLALMAIGVGPGDEVITTSYSFFATGGVISRLGATPVFVDIEAKSFNIAVDAIAARITSKTKAIMPVHLFGCTAEMAAIMELAKKHDLVVIEDACQAIGAEYRGRRAGSLGHMAAFSFFPTKNLGGFGDGGMLTTNDRQLAAKLRILRVHGMDPKYYHRAVGINGRLDALQAAILRVKLRHLDQWTASRQTNARRYAQLIKAHHLDGWIQTPHEPAEMKHVFNQYVVRVPAVHREPLRQYLQEQGVGTEVYYPVPLHEQECFASLGYRQGDLPESERAAAETIALPVYAELTEAQQRYVIESAARYAAMTSGKLKRPAA